MVEKIAGNKKPFFLFRPFYRKIIETGYLQFVDGSYLPTRHSKREKVKLWAYMHSPEKTARELKRQIVKLQGKKFRSTKYSPIEKFTNIRYVPFWSKEKTKK